MREYLFSWKSWRHFYLHVIENIAGIQVNAIRLLVDSHYSMANIQGTLDSSSKHLDWKGSVVLTNMRWKFLQWNIPFAYIVLTFGVAQDAGFQDKVSLKEVKYRPELWVRWTCGWMEAFLTLCHPFSGHFLLLRRYPSQIPGAVMSWGLSPPGCISACRSSITSQSLISWGGKINLD